MTTCLRLSSTQQATCGKGSEWVQSGINWTDVIDTAIVAVPASIAAWASLRNGRKLRTPSGDNIGHVVERTHDLAAVGVAALTGQRTEALSKSEERLNGDPESPINVPPTPQEG